MAGVAGLEPVTSAVTGQRSNQLSYTPRSETQKLLDASQPVNHESAHPNGTIEERLLPLR